MYVQAHRTSYYIYTIFYILMYQLHIATYNFYYILHVPLCVCYIYIECLCICVKMKLFGVFEHIKKYVLQGSFKINTCLKYFIAK